MVSDLSETQEPKETSESLADLFHLVGNLIPEGQDLVTISPQESVANAMTLMKEHNFSQLPVTVGSYVLGVFSYRSFATGLLLMGDINEPIRDLPVEEFVESLQFVQASDNWEAILTHLNQDDGVLVGTHQELEAILTAMDGLTYLADITNPFVWLAEIERSLRRIIRACIPTHYELQECIRNALAKRYDAHRLPTRISEMNFNDYIMLIEHGENWAKFAIAFGESSAYRGRLGRRLREIRDLRNVVFHFKRKLTQKDENTLLRHRDWLQMKVRALEIRWPDRFNNAANRPTEEDYLRLLTRIPVPRGQKQLYKALYDAGDNGLTHDELVEVMNRRDRRDIAGVLGALGRRVNGTPGYGEENQPASNMVIEWEELEDGQWRLRLRPEMRTALEALDAIWLQEMTP